MEKNNLIYPRIVAGVLNTLHRNYEASSGGNGCRKTNWSLVSHCTGPSCVMRCERTSCRSCGTPAESVALTTVTTLHHNHAVLPWCTEYTFPLQWVA